MSRVQIDDTTRSWFLRVFPLVQAAAGQNSDAHGFWDTAHNLQKAEISDDLKKELMNAIGAQKICLMHGELSELMEVYRKDPDAPCEKVPAITMAEEEAADLLIRLMDFCASMNFRLATATLLKMDFNAGRPYKHGRKY